MLRTNSKKAIDNIRQYIADNFDTTNYEPCETPTDFPGIARFILKCFREEKYNLPEDHYYYHNNEQTAFLDWCAGLPSVLDTCYYYNRSAISDIGNILEESDTEQAKYDESDAELLLTKLIYRELLKGEKL